MKIFTNFICSYIYFTAFPRRHRLFMENTL